ncbi:MAG: hypothetical protein C0618_03580 [Desulfuromonas sp.]|nr:MAG: hypothetical protein C0618_03580 [Desulfuromonas sp.]
MDWTSFLTDNETILWQGRPAPRCYTFRHWKLAALGLMLFLLSSVWQFLALELVEDGHVWWLVLIPAPLVVISFLIGPGQILLARMEWEHLFYCLTDQKLLIKKGLLKRQVGSVSHRQIQHVHQRRYSDSLASVRLQDGHGQTLAILNCLEQPQHLLGCLAAVGIGGENGKSV